MINWKDCIVKIGQKKPSNAIPYVWIAYESKPPYLPVAIADSAEELSKEINVSCSTIISQWNRYVRGNVIKTRYHKVKVGLNNDSLAEER